MRISDWSSDVCSSDLAIEDSNLNRLVGGTALDVKRGTSKVEISKRLILAINPRANVVMRQSTWQEAIEPSSEEHTSELQSLIRNSYAVFCLQEYTTTNTWTLSR